MHFVFKQDFDSLITVGFILSTLGSFFLVRSVLLTGAKQMSYMSGTYLGGNFPLLNSLADQKADTMVGFLMTTLGGITVLLGSWVTWSIRYSVLSLFGISILTASAWIFALYFSKILRSRLRLKATAISFGRLIVSYAKSDSQSADEVIQTAMQHGLSELIKKDKSPQENLTIILRYAGDEEGVRLLSNPEFIMNGPKK